MGKYVNAINGEYIGTSYKDKCEGLLKFGAKETSGDSFQEDLICVVNNGNFGAAGYAYSEREYECFKEDCGRNKRWFVLKDALKHSQ